MKTSELIQGHTHTDVRDEIVIELQQMDGVTQKVIEAIETLQKVVVSEVTPPASFETKNAETVKYEIPLKNQLATEKKYRVLDSTF